MEDLLILSIELSQSVCLPGFISIAARLLIGTYRPRVVRSPIV